MILDSGNRREFDTGAVRDIQEGKGRCDLLPLDVVAECYSKFFSDVTIGTVFTNITLFVHTGSVTHLYDALNEFAGFGEWSTLFLEVSKHFEEGNKKYPPDEDGTPNWQKGIPTRCYIDSAVRHFLKWLRDDTDEPHDRAFVWNILCCIWTCIHKPELNDYAKEGESNANI